MTPNDAQIDLLLRRHAGQTRPEQGQSQTKRDSADVHLDADELNAFAEGSLPVAARSRYVSHLTDCDACRRVATQLTISGGAVVAAEAQNTADPQGYSWWKSLSGFFSPLTLRYAAFAVVLVAVVGVVFLVNNRRPRESALTAQNEPEKQTQVEAVKAPDAAPPQSNQNGAVKSDQPITNPQGAASPVSKPEELKSGQVQAPAPKPEQETTAPTSTVLAAKKAAEPVTAESSPPYAPPPPGEAARAGNVYSERQEMPRNVPSGPRKSDSPYDKSKMMDQSRAGEMSKDVRAQDESNRAGVNQTQARGNIQTQSNIQRDADDKAQQGREADTQSSRDRNAKESRAQAPATQSAGTVGRNVSNASEKAPPQTRSAGGRKFRRQGNAWVDSKFKSSMTLKSISRGSSEFDALDSGLRSIAQQISGEVIVVWKNKAYLIR